TFCPDGAFVKPNMSSAVPAGVVRSTYPAPVPDAEYLLINASSRAELIVWTQSDKLRFPSKSKLEPVDTCISVENPSNSNAWPTTPRTEVTDGTVPLSL